MSSARKRQKAGRVATMIDNANQKVMLERHHANVMTAMAEEAARRHDDLVRQLAAAQARIAELREALEWAQQNIDCVEDADERGRCTMRCNEVLAKTDDLSALEAVKAQARRDALLEVLSGLEDTEWCDAEDIAAWVRRMAEEVKS